MADLSKGKSNPNTKNCCSFIKLIVLKSCCVLALTFLAVDGMKLLEKIRCVKDKFGNKNCTCPDDPITEIYVDKEDQYCESYYLCHLGMAFKMQCGMYKAFHPKIKQCMPRTKVPSNVCKPVVDCPRGGRDRYIEDLDDCSKFYLCWEGKDFHGTCPEGYFYHPDKEKCVLDRAQSEACVVVAKKKFFKKLGLAEKPAPKGTRALDQAREYLEQMKG